MTMAVGWSDNCYRFKNFKVTPKARDIGNLHCRPIHVRDAYPLHTPRVVDI